MDTRTIGLLRRKFIAVSTLTYLLVTLFIGGFINLYNIISTDRQIRSALDFIIEHGGTVPAVSYEGEEGPDERRLRLNEESLYSFSPEFRYSARFFSVLFDREGRAERVNTENIALVNDEEAVAMAGDVLRQRSPAGRRGYYAFRNVPGEDGGTLSVFLNCRSQIDTNRRILMVTFIVSAVGFVITFVIVHFLSYRMIAPEIENIKRQKQFITNASHELKTPLAVIRANTEIEEMINGENEWSQSTMRQVDRLNGLVQNLVMITRAAEQEDRSVMGEINVTTVVDESVSPYESLAQQEKKKLTTALHPKVTMIGDESKIRQLITILVDNAFKYCDDEGAIRVGLDTLRKGRIVRITVANTFADGADVDADRFFERFYRADESHNVDRGGYGIGLSIAESICRQYGGSISAAWKDGEIIFTCTLLSSDGSRSRG